MTINRDRLDYLYTAFSEFKVDLIVNAATVYAAIPPEFWEAELDDDIKIVSGKLNELLLSFGAAEEMPEATEFLKIAGLMALLYHIGYEY